jgi:hypothetical protein
MRAIFIVIAIVQLALSPSLASGQTKSVLIENSFCSITVDSQTGAIVGIRNKKTNTTYLSQKKENILPPFVIDTYSANQSVYIRDPFEKQDGGFSTFDPEKTYEEGDETNFLTRRSADLFELNIPALTGEVAIIQIGQ